MTGCLYISPPVFRGQPERGVIPVVLADVMASLKNPDPTAIPFLPSTARAVDIHLPKSTNLVRKLNIIGRTAVALAGDGLTIRKFAYEINQQIDEWRKLERPMRAIGDIANSVGVEAIGIHMMEPPDTRINSMMKDVDFNLPNIGMGGAIGSGKHDLLSLCYEFEEALEKSPPGADVYDKIVGFCSAQTANRLAQEITGSAENKWGGYVEYAFWREDQQKWFRGFRIAHYYFGIGLIENGIASDVGLIPRFFGYNPGDDFARILSVFVPEPNSIDLTDIILENLINSDSAKVYQDGEKFWGKWTPEIATVTLIVPKGDGTYLNITKTLVGEDMCHVLWNVNRNSIAIGIEQEFASKLKKSMIEAIGLSYKE